MTEHTDISAERPDLEDGERAFRTAAGTQVVVSVAAKPHELPGHFAFAVTARSEEADAHGRMITVGPHMVTLNPDGPADLTEIIDRARGHVLDQIDRAVTHARALATLTGVKIETPTKH
jgi:hypothetical protein